MSNTAWPTTCGTSHFLDTFERKSFFSEMNWLGGTKENLFVKVNLRQFSFCMKSLKIVGVATRQKVMIYENDSLIRKRAKYYRAFPWHWHATVFAYKKDRKIFAIVRKNRRINLRHHSTLLFHFSDILSPPTSRQNCQEMRLVAQIVLSLKIVIKLISKYFLITF